MAGIQSQTRASLSTNGVWQLAVGLLLGYPLFAIAVTVPALVGIEVFGGDTRGVVLTLLTSAAVGSGACVLVGRFVGTRAPAAVLGIVGVELQPLMVVLKNLCYESLRSTGLWVFALPYIVSGAVLWLAFRSARRSSCKSPDSHAGQAGEQGVSA